MADEATRKARKAQKVIKAVALCSVALWAVNLVLAFTMKDRGTFGDVFGFSNSLFSAFALLGVALSIAYQREEIHLAREDRKDTKRILDTQQDNLKAQNDATSKQMFESTFFHLFNSFLSLSSTFEAKADVGGLHMDKESDRILRYVTKIEEFKGRRSFKAYMYTFRTHLMSQYRARNWMDDNSVLERAIHIGLLDVADAIKAYQNAYNNLLKEYGSDIGQYFRSLYTILRFITNSAAITDDDKKFYVRLVREQISSDEATMLSINALSEHSTPAFNKLIGDHGLLKNVDHSYHPLDMAKHFINPRAFGETYLRMNGLSDEHFDRYVL